MKKTIIFISLLISFQLMFSPAVKALTTKLTYNSVSQLVAVSNDAGFLTTYVYDIAGRLIAVRKLSGYPTSDFVAKPCFTSGSTAVKKIADNAVVSGLASLSWQPVGGSGFLECRSSSSFFVDQGIPYAASDNKVMKYVNGSWQNVGGQFSNIGRAQYVSLFVDRGTPYLAYMDYDAEYKATVVKYNGSSWQSVGSKGFTQDTAQFISLFVDQGVPYIAYANSFYFPRVMKYENGSWNELGNPGFTGGIQSRINLFVENGTPYLAYVYNNTGGDMGTGKIIVEKYDAKLGWGVAGCKGFSGNESQLKSFFVSQGTIYVAYMDLSNNSRIRVARFDLGVGWQLVGSDIPGDRGGRVSLYVDQGTPYISYTDPNHSHGTTVMKYVDGVWLAVGKQGFSGDYVRNTDLHVDHGNLYVCYFRNAGISVMKHLRSSSFAVGQSSYNLDGKIVAMDATPFVSEGRTFIPVRYLADALGAETGWDEAAGKVTVTKDGRTVTMTIGSSYVTIGGATEEMDTCPVIADGRTYLPARFAAEALGFPVSWDSISQSVVITLSR